MKTLTSGLFVTVVLFNFMFTGCGKEDNATVQKDTKDNTQTQETPPPTNTSAPKIGTIWNQIEKKTDALGQIIKDKKASHLDEPIAEVLNLLKTLPGKSLGIATSKLDVVNLKIKELETIGNTMDQLMHNKKESEVIKEYEKFKQSIDEIKSQYPAESFN
ncbi:MAG: hypothetical protein ABIY50_11545 [Ignavibacteria bacterium]